MEVVIWYIAAACLAVAPIAAVLYYIVRTGGELGKLVAGRPLVVVRLEGARLIVRNIRATPAFIARFAYAADDLSARNLSVELLGSDTDYTGKIEGHAAKTVFVPSESAAHGPQRYGGCADRPRAFAVQLQTGGWFTTLPWWALVDRIRFARKNAS